MVSRLAIALGVLALAGCMTMDDDVAGNQISLDSENCRSDVAVTLVGRDSGANGTTPDDYRKFDSAYRNCMKLKGYSVGP